MEETLLVGVVVSERNVVEVTEVQDLDAADVEIAIVDVAVFEAVELV